MYARVCSTVMHAHTSTNIDICEHIYIYMCVCVLSPFDSKTTSRNKASTLTTTNFYVSRARRESQLTVGSRRLKARYWVQVSAWSSRVQSVCQRAMSLLETRFQRPCVRILHSAEEDNLSSFDSKFACLCQSIKIKNNKHVCSIRVCNDDIRNVHVSSLVMHLWLHLSMHCAQQLNLMHDTSHVIDYFIGTIW